MGISDKPLLVTSTINKSQPLFSKHSTFCFSNNQKVAVRSYQGFSQMQLYVIHPSLRIIRGLFGHSRNQISTPALNKIMENAHTPWIRMSEAQDILAMTAHVARSCIRFHVFGLPSPHEAELQDISVYQHQLANHIITFYTNQLMRNLFRFGSGTASINIAVDDTPYQDIDTAWVTHCFSLPDLNQVTLVPMSNILLSLAQIAQSSQAFVIVFKPENPIRQLLGDFLIGSKHPPLVIICAPCEVDNMPANPAKHDGDRNSDRVVHLLEQYDRYPFTLRDSPDYAGKMAPCCPWSQTFRSAIVARMFFGPSGDIGGSVAAGSILRAAYQTTQSMSLSRANAA
ncbi:hypothetical protein BDV95DRAFT_599092 [Massariosphaeria phaeospora]|uniref:Uncharacterized protein n=1 Tax=Massariosphaeria phaeospora TaxID=100035 RepID=A0A7C8HZB9_9PLEO|nr:hypothetical protein BDV95DRAFT_599092 [Massariosphaeria phaeospora]